MITGREDPLDGSPSRMQTPSSLQPPHEPSCHDTATQKPQQHIDEIDPDRILHSSDSRIHLDLLMDVHATEETKDGSPEDEEDHIPGEHDGEAYRGEDEGDQQVD